MTNHKTSFRIVGRDNILKEVFYEREDVGNGINCAQMADNMTACVNELKELYGDRINEEPVGEKPASEEMLSEIILAG